MQCPHCKKEISESERIESIVRNLKDSTYILALIASLGFLVSSVVTLFLVVVIVVVFPFRPSASSARVPRPTRTPTATSLPDNPGPSSTPQAAAATDAPAATPTTAPVPTQPPEPTESSFSTDTPIPTNTPEPVFVDATALLALEKIGETVTDNFEVPECKKAVFYWMARPTQADSASLILHLHNVETGQDIVLVNEFSVDAPGGISGSTIHALLGGKYYFSSENTDEPWILRVECQDGVAPVGQGIDLQSRGDLVTDNYELPACQKSVFIWSVEPNNGTASLIVHLCKAGEIECIDLANEFDTNLTAPLEGEALQAIPVDGIYYLVTENTNGQPWSIRWECQD